MEDHTFAIGENALSKITTHVLDTSIGRPASGVPVTLENEKSGTWMKVGSASTNQDGRVADLLSGTLLEKGTYRITFELKDYFKSQSRKSFYPSVSIVFLVENETEHHHVPLLLSGYGYSTYRGS